jgi:hypothetical protein
MMMESPTKQEKIKQIFFLVPKKHQLKYAETLLDDHIPLISFFKEYQKTVIK